MSIFSGKALERFGFFMVFSLCLFGVYYSRANLHDFNNFYVGEDGPLEWMTVLALFLASLMSFYRARILRPFRRRRFIFVLYLLSFLFLFGLMEEISWGQRIWELLFDFKVPDFFVKYNTQGETNFHNLKFGDFRVNKVIFGSFLGLALVFYFIFLPYLYKKVEKIRVKVDSWALPLPRIYHIVAYLFLALLGELIAGAKKGEILEFGGSWIVLLMFFNPSNREIFSRKSIER